MKKKNWKCFLYFLGFSALGFSESSENRLWASREKSAQDILQESRAGNAGLDQFCKEIESYWAAQGKILGTMRGQIVELMQGKNMQEVFSGVQKRLLEWRKSLYLDPEKDQPKDFREAESPVVFLEVLSQEQAKIEEKSGPLHQDLQVRIQARTQKMGVVLNEMLKKDGLLYIEPELFAQLFPTDAADGQTNWPAGFFPDVQFVMAENQESILASARGLALKLLLFATLDVLQGFDKTMDSLGELKNHPFAHLTPLPLKDKSCTDVMAPARQDYDRFSSCPFLCWKNGKPYLLVLHNGYAFGAQRFEQEGKQSLGANFFPDDCSSFVARYLEAPYSFSTKDMQFFVQDQTGFFFKDEAFAEGDKEVSGEEIAKRWRSKFLDPWKSNSLHHDDGFWNKYMSADTGLQDVSVGDIWVYSQFKDWYVLDKDGFPQEKGPAHTGIVVGKDLENDRVLLLNTNRCIEKAYSFSAGKEIQDLDGIFLQWVPSKVTSKDSKESPANRIFYLKKMQSAGSE